MSPNKHYLSLSGKQHGCRRMRYGRCFSSIIRKLQEVPSIEHFVETMSIRFHNRKGKKPKSLKNMNRAIFIWMWPIYRSLRGNKSYLFVAIDRATRSLFYRVYEAKSSENTEDFINRRLEFLPLEITHVLTDNGLEFTNRLINPRKENSVRNPLNWMKSARPIILNRGWLNSIHQRRMAWWKEPLE